jgi:hypothetical protein
MTTQQLPAPVLASPIFYAPISCRDCAAPFEGPPPRALRCEPCADHKSLEREAQALIVIGSMTMALGGSLLGYLALHVV